MSRNELVIAGALGGANIGESFLLGSQALDVRAHLVDTCAAYSRTIMARLQWRFFGHRPAHLERYSRSVEDTCGRTRPRWLLTVGIAPINARTIYSVRDMGVKTLNFLTDDPFNPAHRGAWALKATRAYDVVFSPRRANMADLRELGCSDVRYLPFGYDPRYCFRDPNDTHHATAPDIIFVGGGDADRVPWIRPLIDAGFKVVLYGSYWNRFRATRAVTKGQADPLTIRKATATSKIALCLVRRANRDGHVMRSLEMAATGACMLVEDTEEHRALFGADGACVTYFQNESSLVERARQLLDDEPTRLRLAKAVYEHVRAGRNTYTDRLSTILGLQ